MIVSCLYLHLIRSIRPRPTCLKNDFGTISQKALNTRILTWYLTHRHRQDNFLSGRPIGPYRYQNNPSRGCFVCMIFLLSTNSLVTSIETSERLFALFRSVPLLTE